MQRFTLVSLTVLFLPTLAAAQCDQARLPFTTFNGSRSVALSGDRVVVGHPGGPEHSHLRVFERVAGVWTGPAVVLAPPGPDGQVFGDEVALDGDLLATSDLADDFLAENAGAVHLFEADALGNWLPVDVLRPDAADANAHFGASIAVDEAALRIFVGAPRHGVWDYGGVFVFEFLLGEWRQVDLILPKVPYASAGFGDHLDIDGGRLVVGQIQADSVYVFDRANNGDWIETQLIPDPFAGFSLNTFGTSVAVDGGVLVVGDYRANNGSGPPSGRAWVYEFDGSAWNEAAVLEPGPSNGHDFFGLHVDVDGDVIAAAAPQADGFGESLLGRVEVFERKANGSWDRVARLRAADGFANDALGWSGLALEGERVVALALEWTSRPNGGLVWENATSCPGPSVGTPYCVPTQVNSLGLHGRLVGTGSGIVASAQFVLDARDLPAGVPAYALASRDTDLVVMPPGSQGTLCLGGSIGRMVDTVAFTKPNGRARFPVFLERIPTTPEVAVMPGETWRFQAWYRDMNPGPTSNFTEALEVVFQ